MTLAERLVAVHEALEAAGLPHAFGGAIALAYWTLEPRGTRDLDVNVFVDVARAADVLAALPTGVAYDTPATTALTRDGQVRVFWDDTPIDLFLDYHAIHREAARAARDVPFAGTMIPVLGPVELSVFKTMSGRTKHWADIEAMLAAATVTADEIAAALRGLLEPDDRRWDRLEDARRRASR